MKGKIVIVLATIFAIGIALSLSGCIEEPETTTTPMVTATATPSPTPSSALTPSPTPSATPSKTPTKKPSPSSLPASTASGTFQLLVSDAPADITDFKSLVVTFSEARVFTVGENDSKAGFRILDLNSSTADLTELIDEKALPIVNTTLEAGNYSKIELAVNEVEAVLVNNETATVKIPSKKLKITKNFVVTANETTKFVFDINVVRKGHANEYNLLPVIAKSGVVGVEISEDEVLEVTG